MKLFVGEKTVECAGKLSLLEHLYREGIFPHAPCGGRGICGKCLVDIEDSAGRRSVVSCTYIPEDDTRVFPKAPSRNGGAECISGIIGFAVDIGTTAVKISAVSSDDSRIIASIANPQRVFGADVVSRIAAADRYGEMGAMIRRNVAAEISAFADYCNIRNGGIDLVAVTGNTAMIALFAGIDISAMGAYPYRAPLEEISSYNKTFDELSSNCGIKLLPAVSAFLGADFLCGLYEARLMEPENLLYCDMGTNGEMCICSGGNIYASSVPMGPAIEGLGLSMGMCADDGAVIRAQGNMHKIIYTLYSGTKPAGIAGSGIIDIIDILRKSGAVDRSGKINEVYASGEGDSEIILAGAMKITQKDLRTFQLAKGACLASAKILSEKSGISTDGIRTVISGSFGEKINPDALMNLSFFPPGIKRPEAAGNLALKGAERLIRDPLHARELQNLGRKIKTLELSLDSSFHEIFIKSLSF